MRNPSRARKQAVRSLTVAALNVAALLLVAATSGCNAPRVERQAETARFNAALEERCAGLALDPKQPVTLAQCESIALRNNLAYRVTLLQTQLQDDKVRLALAGILPQVSLEFDNSHRNNQPLVRGPGGQSFKFDDMSENRFNLRAVVPIFDFGATYFAYHIAKDRETQEKLAAVRARQQLLRDVRVAYAQHAAAVRQEKLAQVAVAAAQEVLKTTQSLQREGLGSSADTAFVEAALAQAGLEVLLAQRRIEESRLRLNTLLSLAPWTAYQVDTVLPPAAPLPAPERIAELEQSALRARPELWSQDLEQHLTANEVRRRISAFFPHIDGLSEFDWSSVSTQVNPAFGTLGFMVGQSLLDGTSGIWRYRLAKKQVNVEQERALLVALGVLFDVDLRVLQLRRADAAVLAMSKVAEAQETLLKEVTARYREGLENGANAARALAELRGAQRELDQARTDYLAAWYELNAASLSEEAVQADQAARELDAKPVTGDEGEGARGE
ncbi:MAG: TolC family protein [Planctomycetota bacterium]